MMKSHEDMDIMELDSLCSQNSRVLRKRLLAPWRSVDVKLKSKFTEREAIEEFSEIAAPDRATIIAEQRLRSEVSSARRSYAPSHTDSCIELLCGFMKPTFSLSTEIYLDGQGPKWV